MNFLDLKNRGMKFKTDSRKIEKNDVFLALNGENTDGNLFIDDAFKKGASFAFSEKEDLSGGNIIYTENIQNKLLEETSDLIKTNSKMNIAVTGSNGKTTTKEILFSLLSPYIKTFRTEGNMNTETGIPLCILNDYSGEETCIFEMGLRKKGDLEFLTKFYKPDVAFITSVGSSHMEFLGTRKNIADEKMKITSNMDKGLLIMDGDETLLTPPKNLNVLKFGKNKSNDGYLENYEYINFKTKVYYNIFGKSVLLTLNDYWSEGQLKDLLACLIFAVFIQIPLDPYAISAINIPAGRFKIYKKKNNHIIDDSYNASYESFINAFNSVRKMGYTNKVLIMGEMFELGDSSENYHNSVFEEAFNTFDKVYFYNISGLKTPDNVKLINFNSVDTIKDIILKEKGLIYIKGSNGTGIYSYLKNSDILSDEN